MYEKIKYLSAGDKAVVMEFGNEISKEINAKIRNVVKSIDEAKIDGIEELLPTYRSLMIMYEPLRIEYSELISTLDSMSSKQVESQDEEIRIVEFPTVYGGEYGPDINFVAE
ncbi:MAG TPA: allophanate hydrolase, partial [Clostridiales bacterium]|nr:allophanate hydrolase [Clostridiales bacterium]